MNTNHPPETNLALFAAGDAGPIQQWRIQRHVGACAECRETVAQYSALRCEIAESGATAEIEFVSLRTIRAGPRATLLAGRWLKAGAFLPTRAELVALRERVGNLERLASIAEVGAWLKHLAVLALPLAPRA